MPAKLKFIENSLHKKWARTAAFWWTLLIFILCLIPGQDIPNVNIPLADKWTHLILFGVFSFLWLKACVSISAKQVIVILFASIYIGWIVEYIQGHFTPDRTQDNMDTVADIIGSIAGAVLFIFILATATRRNP